MFRFKRSRWQETNSHLSIENKKTGQNTNSHLSIENKKTETKHHRQHHTKDNTIQTTLLYPPKAPYLQGARTYTGNFLQRTQYSTICFLNTSRKQIIFFLLIYINSQKQNHTEGWSKKKISKPPPSST